MKVYAGMDKDSDQINSMMPIPANMYTWKARQANSKPQCGPVNAALRPITAEGKLQDLIKTAKVHIRSKGQHPFRVIKQLFNFQKTRLLGMAQNHCKVFALATPTNLFLGRCRFLATP
jgi:IS5 family transposase